MPQKARNKAKAIILPLVLLAAMFTLQLAFVSAANATYDQILQPIQAIYDLVKYAVTIIAGLVLLFAGISYIMSGSDPMKRDKAKNMIMYVLIGLAVIWAAPFIVKLVLGQ
jgi:hypothetical protein